jgi:TM2 domain-containing protein
MTNQAAEAKTTASVMMRYDANKKSMTVSYLLWFFLGMLGAHRFFLGQKNGGRSPSSRSSSSAW